MEAQNSDIKKSLKATSLFGGVQVFGIVTSIVRSKLVALLIGPVGIGIVELYSSTIRLIGSFTDFSLQVSSVRDVSIASKSGDRQKLNKVVNVLMKIGWITGLLGLLVCLLGSPFWSKLTFGDYSYTFSFALLSIILLINQLQKVRSVILQGTENYRYLAYSSFLGNLLGLFTTIPIYYFMGIDGIIPVLIITAITAYWLTKYYSSKIKINKNSTSFVSALKEGKFMLRQGFLISINYLFSALVFYVLRIFITDRGGVSELGLYAAGFAVINSYVGLVFQAMSQEYYPRLSSLSEQKDLLNQAVNNQIYLSLLILGPLVFVFLFFSDYILMLLYSDKFVDATQFMAFSMLGVLFQASSWCMSFTLLAKGDNKIFLISETVSKTQRIATDILFYFIWGLAGIGLSFIVSYIIYTIQCAYVCHKRCNLVLEKRNLLLQFTLFVIGCVIIFLTMKLPVYAKIVTGVVIVFVATLYSYNKFDEIIDIKSFIRKKR